MDNQDNINTQADNVFDFKTGCVDEDGVWPKKANEVVPQITDNQCDNLGANRGLSGNVTDNCEELQELICDIKQEVDAIASGRVMVIATNDASKCQDDYDPTLASMWSRLLRWAQAMTCIICAYDPFIATILTQGKFPQVLMGSDRGSKYPQWVTPDTAPTEGSEKPITSGAVRKGIDEALTGVWHLWEEQPEFQYFAQSIDDTTDPYNLNSQTGMVEGDTGLVSFDGTNHNALYKYTGGKWVYQKSFTVADGLVNFSVTHIAKGYYADKGVYYFHDGTTDTWQVMDADLGEIGSQLAELEQLFKNTVVGAGQNEGYILTTRSTLAEATSVPCDETRPTIVLITG